VFTIRNELEILASLPRRNGSESKQRRKQTAASSLLVYTIQKLLDAGGFEARTCSTIMHQTQTRSNTKNTKTKYQAGQLRLQLPLLIGALLDIRILLLFLRKAACQTLEK
jgi:hypothetical protein